MGYYELTWESIFLDGREGQGDIDIARLVTPEYTKSIKMVLVE